MAQYIDTVKLKSIIEKRNGRIPDWIEECIIECEEELDIAPTQWTKVSESLPIKEGKYLCCCVRAGLSHTEILSFTSDLRKVNKFQFQEHNAGFYRYDSEWGYVQCTSVRYWMPLPLSPIQK